MRLVLLLVTDGISYAGFRATGNADPLTAALVASDFWIVPVDLITLAVLAWLMKREGGSLRGLLGRLTRRDLALAIPAFLPFAVAFLASSYAGNLIVYQGAPPRTAATSASRCGSGSGRSRSCP